MIKNEKGQAMIEVFIIAVATITLLSGLFYMIVDGIHLYVWHHNLNKALLCALEETKESRCLKELKSSSKTSLPFPPRVIDLRFERIQGRPQITVQLEGSFNEKHKIKKRLNPSTWKI